MGGGGRLEHDGSKKRWWICGCRSGQYMMQFVVAKLGCEIGSSDRHLFRYISLKSSIFQFICFVTMACLSPELLKYYINWAWLHVQVAWSYVHLRVIFLPLLMGHMAENVKHHQVTLCSTYVCLWFDIDSLNKVKRTLLFELELQRRYWNAYKHERTKND
jgi:hypothetical protein